MNTILTNFFAPMIKEGDVQIYTSWLRGTPKLTTYRVNTLSFDVESLISKIQFYLEEQKLKYNRKTIPKVYQLFSETIAVECWPTDNENESFYDPGLQDVIVDAPCGSAVLRGANVFAPAVMGLPPDVQIDESVNIFADVAGKCKQGLKIKYDNEEKVFVGLGKLKMLRKQLYNTDNIKPKGIAIETIMPESRVPVIDHGILPEGSCILQNLPSIICSRVLNPEPGEIVLDMCAAPGNKTTHLTEIMQDKGIIIALDKTEEKIKLVRQQCHKFQYKIIHPFAFDSTKAAIDTSEISNNEHRDILQGPPFLPETFDKILLDAPCSALGQRPVLKLPINEKCLKSYVSLQRKLFYSAVALLKTNGRLVYSTCTLRSQECEEMVSWALKTFQCLKLVPAEPLLGDPGWENCGLNDDQRLMVQRFGPQIKDALSRSVNPMYKINDTIGFFIACFTKMSISTF